MKILLTGDRGYLGSVLSRLLRESGNDVVGYDIGFFDSPAGKPGQDIRLFSSQHVTGFDAIVNLAALCNDACGEISSRTTHEINNSAAVRLATLACAAGVKRFVQISSCSVYGAAGEAEVDESSPTAPQTAYAVSKLSAERYLSLLAAPSFSVTALRLATLFGTAPSFRSDVLLNRMVGSAIRWGTITISGAGSIQRPLLHVTDAARAIGTVLTADSDRLSSPVYNVGANDQNYSLEDVAELTREICPQTHIRRIAGADQRSYKVRFDHFRQSFPEWSPLKNPANALLELSDVYREMLAGAPLIDGSWGVTDRYEHLLKLRQAGLVGPDFQWVSAHRP
jgi:nucleoside-diphosphate-sugar epimerase